MLILCNRLGMQVLLELVSLVRDLRAPIILSSHILSIASFQMMMSIIQIRTDHLTLDLWDQLMVPKVLIMIRQFLEMLGSPKIIQKDRAFKDKNNNSNHNQFQRLLDLCFLVNGRI